MASKLSQTIANADARLVNAVGNRNVPGFVLIREWPYLAAAAGSGDAVEDLFTANVGNATGTVTNPQANGDAYTGTFVYSKIESRDENTSGSGDRAAVIIETLTKVTTIASSSDLSDPFIKQNNLIIFPLRSEVGEQDQIVLTYVNVNPASRQVCTETITDAQLKAIADALVTGTPWTYVSREFEEEDNKTATFSVVFSDYNSDATASGSTGAIVTEIQKAVGGNRREVDIQTKEKVTAAIADSIISTGTGWGVPTGYSLLTLRRRNHSDGTATVFQISVKAVTWTFNPSADEQFEIVFWGDHLRQVKENEEVKFRTVTEHTERLYTNTQANAEDWALTADISTGYSWSDDSYIASNGVDERNLYERGHLTQAIRGDYRWIAYRTSKMAIGQQAVQSEV